MIDRMTLAEAGEIFRYWEANPPMHLMLQVIARLLGWQPPHKAAASSVADLAAMPPPGLAVAPAADIAMPAIFDLDTLRARNRARLDARPQSSLATLQGGERGTHGAAVGG